MYSQTPKNYGKESKQHQKQAKYDKLQNLLTTLLIVHSNMQKMINKYCPPP